MIGTLTKYAMGHVALHTSNVLNALKMQVTAHSNSKTHAK